MTDRKESLDRVLISGMGWNATGRWVGQLISWSSTLIVLRFLTPSDYGLVAMGGVLFSLITMLSDAGISSAIIQRQERSVEVVHQLTSIAVLLGAAGMVLALLLAEPLASFFKQPQLAPVIMVVGASYAVMGFRVVPIAVLKRDLAFRYIAANDLLVVVVTALTSVVLAWQGSGYWALIISSITGTIVGTIAAWRRAPQSLRIPRWDEVREAAVFGTHRLTSTLADWFRGNADSVVIGRWLSQGALGSYRIAMEFASLPLEKVAGVVLQVVYPVVSAVRDDKTALARYLLLLTEGLAMLTWPLAVGLMLVADIAVPVILGEQWRAAVAPLTVFAGAAMVRAIMPLVDAVAVIRGHARLVARVAVVGSVATIAAMIPAARWGIVGVAGVWAGAFPLLMLPILVVALRETGVTSRQYTAALGPTAIACVIEAIAVIGLRNNDSVGLLALPTQLALSVTGGALAYLVAILAISPSRVRSLWRLVSERHRGPPLPAAES